MENIKNDTLEFSGAKEGSQILGTKYENCLICQVGEIVPKKRSAEKELLVVYSRNGLKKAIHEESRCNFQNKNFSCGAGYFHGYMTYKGSKIYHDSVLNNDVLVTSDQTGFEMDYLVELAGDVQISSTTFEGAAKKYNRFHNINLPHDVLERRVELCRKRISDAYNLFCYLEYCQRYQIPNHQIIKNDIDDSIMEHKEEMMSAFRERWTVNHKCDRPGCKTALVIDGGLKPHRNICGAKTCGVRVFATAGVTVMTGCPSIPQPNTKFCFDHQDGQHPVIPGERLGSKSVSKLKKFRKEECKEAQDDDFFHN